MALNRPISKLQPNDIEPEIFKSITCALSSAPDAVEQLRLILVESIRKDPRYGNRPLNTYLSTPLVNANYAGEACLTLNKAGPIFEKSKNLVPKIKTEPEEIKSEPSSPPALSLPEELYVSDGNDSEDIYEDGLTLVLGNDNKCKACSDSKWTSHNRLIECVECHSLYHQECHLPPILKTDVNDPRFVWYCANCTPSSNPAVTKSQTIQLGLSSSSSSNLSSKSSSSSGKSSPLISRNSPLQSFSNKTSSSSKSSSGSSSKSSSSSSSSSSKLPQPKINIITADKRIQIMKKRAAKKQEETRGKRKIK